MLVFEQEQGRMAGRHKEEESAVNAIQSRGERWRGREWKESLDELVELLEA
jgi:hypothetical protein